MLPGRIEHIWAWLSEHREVVEGYAVVDDMDLSFDFTGQQPREQGPSSCTAALRADRNLGACTQPSCIADHFVRTPGTVGLDTAHSLLRGVHSAWIQQFSMHSRQDYPVAMLHGCSQSCRRSQLSRRCGSHSSRSPCQLQLASACQLSRGGGSMIG